MPFGLVLNDLLAVATVLLLAIALVLVRRMHAGAQASQARVERALGIERTGSSRGAQPEPSAASRPQVVSGPSHARDPLARRLALVEALAVAIGRDLAEGGGESGRAHAVARAQRIAQVAAGGRARDEHTTLSLVLPLVRSAVGARLAAIHVTLESPDDLPPVVGSADGWTTILTALATNGIEAMRGGGSLTVRCGHGARDTWARITVADTGRGIPADVLAHVTEPFYTTRAATGAEGLGLPTVAAMIEALGGVLTVTSTVGGGTTVTMDVPFATPWSGGRFGGTVLVADDDAEMRHALGRLLGSFGLDVVEVESGSSARARLLAEPARWVLAVLDVVMPGTPVVEVIGDARTKRADLPVLLVSGYDTMHMVDAALAAGGVRFLRKPFTREELHRALTDLVPTPPVTAG